MNVAPADGTPKWNLTNNFKEEKMTVFLVLALLMGTGLIGVVVAVVKANAMVYVGITGVMSAAMWMPYLMALIYYGTDKGKPMSGLYKKLAYDPAIHRLMSTPGALPKWVKRAFGETISVLVIYYSIYILSISNDTTISCYDHCLV